MCGDGYATGLEDCDDGNTQSGDGCSSACQSEVGSFCVPGTGRLSASVCMRGSMSMHEAFEVPEAQQAWSLAVTNTTGAWIVSPAFARFVYLQCCLVCVVSAFIFVSLVTISFTAA